MDTENYLKKELYELMKKDSFIFEFIQNGSLDGLWYWDLEKPENEWMNKSFWEVLGYDPSEKKHLASQWQDIIFKEDLEKALENFHKHCKDSKHPYDQIVRYQHKKGHTVWIRCKGLAIRDKTGKPIRMLGVYIDITEQKEKEKELVEKSKMLKAILDSSLDSIVLLDKVINKNNEIVDFKFIMANSKACEVINLPEDKILGKTLFELMPGNFQPLETLNNKSLFEEYKEVVMTGKSKVLEFYFGFDNINEWFSNKVVKYNDGFVCTFAVITKEKELQLKLEKKVKEKVAKQRKQEQLLIQQSKMASMGEMLGAIAHNWRQPLNSLSLLTTAIDIKFENNKVDDSYMKSWKEKVNKQLTFMSNTIDSFCDFYKPKERVKTILVKELLNNLVLLFDVQFKVHGIYLKTKVDKDIEIRSFEKQIQQVLINLLSNSKDAILDRKIQKGIIYIKAYKKSENIRIEVEDNAGGIKNDKVLNRIFEPYFTTKVKGTGIGLYMSKMLVDKNLKGKITAENIKEGLQIKLILPKDIK